jgi:hypothetical protein
MKLPRTRFLLAQVLLFASIVYATDDKDTSVNLQALDFSFPGVLITGELRSGVNASILENEAGYRNTGIGAASEADVKIQARPTKESRATVLFRIHQDWQKAHEEGVSPFLLDWISYDGRAWGSKIDFNLGDMRVAYTPFTLSVPSLNLANEPEILSIRRKDVMSYRHLNDTDQRLLQGFNFAINSGAVSVFDNLSLQGTFSRLRAQSKKVDQIFFDFDDTDRWLFAGRGGAELFGVSVGINYVYTFTRESGLENFSQTVTVDPQEPFLIEDNSVFSGTLGVDIAKLAGMNGWKIGLSGEYAISSYETSNFYREAKKVTAYRIDSAYVLKDDVWEKIWVVAATTRDSVVYRTEKLDTKDGSAILASLDFATPSSIANLAASFKYIKNDKDFVSEAAQSPIYYKPSKVLNAPAVDGLRIAASTIENLYFANYTNDPLTKYNLSGDLGGDNNNLNNNKKAHFLRSGYHNSIWTPAELRRISTQEIDPGVNLALPFGLATPDRSGFLFNVNWSFINNSISLNGFVNRVAQEEDIGGHAAPVYLDLGGGLDVEIGRLIGWERKLNLNGGFGKASETDGYERSSTRASAGLRAHVWRGISLLGGFQMVNKDYGNLFETSVTGDELLWLAGPEIKITEGSYFNLQYGMLNYEFKDGVNTHTLDRSLVSADVRVKF